MSTHILIGGPFDGTTRTLYGTPTILQIERRNGMFSTYRMRKIVKLLREVDEKGSRIIRLIYRIYFHSRLRRRTRNRCVANYIVAAMKAGIVPSDIEISLDLPECFEKGSK